MEPLAEAALLPAALRPAVAACVALPMQQRSGAAAKCLFAACQARLLHWTPPPYGHSGSADVQVLLCPNGACCMATLQLSPLQQLRAAGDTPAKMPPAVMCGPIW